MAGRRVSDATRIAQHRGEGHGKTYKPWVKVRDLNSMGTCSNPIDWKHGRTMQLLSQGEMYLYYILRWDDNVVDIREQFPLDLKTTVALAEELGISHPGGAEHWMTTDFLVDYKDGTKKAFSMKPNRNLKDRCIEKLFLEKEYWERQGIEFNMAFKNELNITYAENIRAVVPYYDIDECSSRMDYLKHLIARKEWIVDMESEEIDFSELIKEYNAITKYEGENEDGK